jgi:hypothetical protein
MIPDKLTFILYKLVVNLQVQMGNNSYLPVLGKHLAVISLNSQRIQVRNEWHILGLVIHLCSLCLHFTKPGCGFTGANSIGSLVYFPTFVFLVDTSKDCHLAYKPLPLGCFAPFKTLHYVQPCSSSSKSLAIIEDDSSQLGDSDALIWCFSQPKCVSPTRPPSPMLVAATPSTGALPEDLESVSAQFCSLADAVSSLTTPVSPASPIGNATTHGSHSSPILASTLTCDEIVLLMHHNNSSLHSVCPCNTANALDTKTHWLAKELHRIMDCHNHKFWSYKTIL